MGRVRAVLVLVALVLGLVAPTAAAGADEDVVPFGAAEFHGSTTGLNLNAPLVGMARTAAGKGYWLLAEDGGIFSFGDARFHGSTGGVRLNRPVVDLAADPRGRGYWSVAADGGVFAFDVPFFGSMGNRHLDQPVVGMAATATGDGYWLVGHDGGIFSFGNAVFSGSTGSVRLNQPIVGMAADPDGVGYWLVAADGGVFTFDAPFHGSAVGLLPAGDRAIGIAAHPGGSGYWVGTEGGGVYTFGAIDFHGAGSGNRTIVAIEATSTGNGYWLAGRRSGRGSEGTVRFDGIGPVRVGMTLAEASRALGSPVRIDPNSAPDPSICGFAYEEGGSGNVAFMVYDDRIQRVDVLGDRSIRTEAGVGVGSTTSQVRAAYPAMASSPHPYDPSGQRRYLIVDEAGPHKMIFETSAAGEVETFRSGFDAAVDAPEGCV